MRLPTQAEIILLLIGTFFGCLICILATRSLAYEQMHRVNELEELLHSHIKKAHSPPSWLDDVAADQLSKLTQQS